MVAVAAQVRAAKTFGSSAIFSGCHWCNGVLLSN